MATEFSEIAAGIESVEFKFVANQAAGLSLFREIVEEQASFRSLVEIAAKGQNAARITKRILELAALHTDSRYVHPYDTAIAAYLMALEKVQSEFLLVAVISVLPLRQTWWSMRIAENIFRASLLESTLTIPLLSIQWPKKTLLNYNFRTPIAANPLVYSIVGIRSAVEAVELFENAGIKNTSEVTTVVTIAHTRDLGMGTSLDLAATGAH